MNSKKSKKLNDDIMKNIFLFFLTLIFSLNGFGQENSVEIQTEDKYQNLDSMGINNEPYLNMYEVDFFNNIFLKQRKEFDFNKKKVAFLTGGSGKTLSDKKKYFDLEKERLSRGYSGNGGTLIILDEEQRKETGGYDMIILYWSKILPTKKQLVKLLKQKDN